MSDTARSAWVKRLPGAEPAAHHLVCFPHAGGGASFFRPWWDTLPPATELLVIQYPGREDRLQEPFAETVEEVVEGVSSQLTAELDGTPVTFFGHSMGALIAYEVARHWERLGLPGPERLVVSGQYAPGELPPQDVHERDDDGVLEVVERLGGAASDVRRSPELKEFVAALTRADYRMLDGYEPFDGEPVTAALTALCGRDDPAVSPEDVARWRDFTTGPFELLRFPGGHFYLRDGRQAVISALAGALPHATGQYT
ncbi:thioesterase II family protein [Streptomyces rimosus]|uniref:thioesterase II family protein n=1 Tax=Streptomyces rimosus TaxID=1927 RepID=UPI0037CDDC5B